MCNILRCVVIPERRNTLVEKLLQAPVARRPPIGATTVLARPTQAAVSIIAPAHYCFQRFSRGALRCDVGVTPAGFTGYRDRILAA